MKPGDRAYLHATDYADLRRVRKAMPAVAKLLGWKRYSTRRRGIGEYDHMIIFLNRLKGENDEMD